MAIITLTSDWGLKDHYCASVKGYILNHCKNANIVDISHQINPYDIFQAFFILKNSYTSFPKGSIHIIGVNTEASIQTPHVVVFFDGHYFIGADNGIFSMLCGDKAEKVIEIEVMQESKYFTFSSRDVFAKVACMLASGEKLESIGKAKSDLFKKMYINPIVDDNKIKGNIVYIDNYENVITNIPESLFKSVGKNKPFEICFKIPGYEITTISKSYADVPIGDKLALFGSTGMLEIAINQDKASSLLGLRVNDTVRIEFIKTV